jgi:hypothetical protein
MAREAVDGDTRASRATSTSPAGRSPRAVGSVIAVR